MRCRSNALAGVLVVLSTACHAHGTYGAHALHHSATYAVPRTPALHATNAQLPVFAAPHASLPVRPVAGYSAARVAHVTALQHCNPFAHVHSETALALCG
jgi:hypothetical protein